MTSADATTSNSSSPNGSAIESPWARQRLARVVDLLGRGIDAVERRRRAVPQDQLAERAGAAADIKPARAFRCIEPGEESLADRAAPAPHVALVVVRRIEGDFDFGHAAPLTRASRCSAPRRRE